MADGCWLMAGVSQCAPQDDSNTSIQTLNCVFRIVPNFKEAEIASIQTNYFDEMFKGSQIPGSKLVRI